MKKRTLDIMIGIFLSIFLVLLVICLVKFGREKLGKKDPTMETEDTYQTDTYEDIDTEVLEEEMWDTEVTETEVEGTELSEEEIAIMESEMQESENEESEEKDSEKSSEKEEKKKPKYPYYIKVNRQANCVTVYTYDDNGEYTVPVKAMVCSTGRNKGTPTGVFRTQAKYTWRTLYGNVYGQYSTRINGNVLFHSVPYRKTQKDTLITKYYNQLGTAASAGCVRLTCADAKWIYDNCALGTTVEIYDGSSAGPLGKPSAIKIDTNHPCAGWDPTDPDSKNPWRKQGPIFTGVKDTTIERGENIDLASNVSAVDTYGNAVTVQISGTVDTKVCGEYKVTYSATDSSGKSTTAKAVVTVKDTVGPTISQTGNITVYNSTKDMEKVIKAALSVTDAGETLDTSAITLDMSKLKNAMNSKSYGTIKVDASAKDAYGNKSKTFEVKVVYAQVDESAPVITLTGNPASASVDLTNVADENARRTKIEDAAKGIVNKGTHYTVKDDVSSEKDIVCSVSCDYVGETSAGKRDVTVIITAKDKAGKTSKKEIVVSVSVSDNTVTGDNTEEDTPTDTETQIPEEPTEDTQGTQNPGDSDNTGSTEDTNSENKSTEDANTNNSTQEDAQNINEDTHKTEDMSKKEEDTQDIQGVSESHYEIEELQNSHGENTNTETMDKNNENITDIQEISSYNVLETKMVA